ncbi:hypothetical protein PGUG_04483 [Meyerozyma guilliermondii ATCC 6260]|uniref:Small ribosomal subunit protein mS35 n=1 Tax=Meyerozyma guilliermondii (strain ATCC 6260 / CBS 566 / DSM 6381 / JCM 1539 / NBRC 10279 / NRRL Y-324) TaxID=294746 RepID=A5DMI2_PICGU|nr:uncharacterized protein PGUG_04483 [Meyerozyma guilliermondii ATCC 6260]EDK40385.2 hypothetical protein PGUG_04483 [Meyerozyma guilliermondii ATCC 6260]
MNGATALRCSRRLYSTQKNAPLYLNPHAWKNLPADRIFELHKIRQEALGEKYNPNDAERNAILSTIESLGPGKSALEYAYEIDNFKERHMNNTPVNLRGLPPRKSNINVIAKGSTPHEIRKREQIMRTCAYEMPLLAKYRQEYKPRPNSETPLSLRFHSDFTDESNANNRKVTLRCKIEDLNLNEKQQKKFMILSGNRFNHRDGAVKFACAQYPEATQNARWLVDTFNRLLEQAKDLTDDFADVPIDTRHMQVKKSKPQFPEHWKRPQDAPVERHAIVARLVDRVKSYKDQSYIEKFTP